jgi:hypothetical protein
LGKPIQEVSFKVQWKVANNHFGSSIV